MRKAFLLYTEALVVALSAGGWSTAELAERRVLRRWSLRMHSHTVYWKTATTCRYAA